MSYEIADYGNELVFILKGKWKNKYCSTINRKHIRRLRLDTYFDWDGKSIEFISELESITSININSSKLDDITPLADKNKITEIEFGYDCKFTNSIDFRKFKKLKSFSAWWTPAIETPLMNTSIQYLRLSRYPYSDLRPIKSTKIKSLFLSSRKLKSLKGVNQFSNIREIELCECPNLEIINELSKCAHLKSIIFESCGKIKNCNPFSKLKELRRLDINNCGEIKSIIPLKHILTLEDFCMDRNSKIEDGKISFLAKLPNLKNIWIRDRRNYDEKIEIIRHKIGMD